eukprot:Selendium_serpulae@DN4513_c0_g1_i4.p1
MSEYLTQYDSPSRPGMDRRAVGMYAAAEHEEIELGEVNAEIDAMSDSQSLIMNVDGVDYENADLRRAMLMDDPLTESARMPIEGQITYEDGIDWGLSLGTGSLVGFLFAKTLCFLPQTMHYQLTFEHQQFLKVCLSGAGTVCALTVILSFLKADFSAKRYGSRGFLNAAIGGSLLGVGIAMSGCTPGFEFIQIGSGIWLAGFVVLGGLLAALLHGFLDGFTGAKLEEIGKIDPSNLDGLLNLDYWMMAIPWSVALIAGAVALEIAIPATDDYPKKPSIGAEAGALWFYKDFKKVWPPYVAGAGIGILTVLLKCGYGARLSFYNWYTTIWGMIFRPALGDNCPQDFKHATMKHNISELFLMAGTGLGAWIGVDLLTDPSMMEATKGVAWYWGMAGGFIALYGARLGGGDFITHCIAGVGDMNLPALVSTICIILGGFATSMILKKADVDIFDTDD